MEYIYGALLLHSAGKKVDDEGLKKVISAVGIEVNEAKVKALVSSLENVNIDEAIKTSAIAVAPSAQVAQVSGPKPEEKQEKKKDEGKSEEEAASGLAALFG